MLNKILWAFDRWRVMDHPKEELYRIKQQIQYRFIDKLWYRRLPIRRDFVYNDSAVLSRYSIEGLSKVVHATAHNVKHFKLLNTNIEDIITNEKWNYDFKNNIKAPSTFVHDIDDFNYDLGEVKYVYELSRLYHLPILAAYAIANADKELLNKIERQLHDWSNQNLFLNTIAWKSGNVVGIRVVNLIVYRSLLSLANVDCSSIDLILNPLIELHYKFLISHLSLYSSRGNHHIGELAGVIAICASYKFKNSDLLLNSYFKELESEVLRLIHTDGFNKEQATRYQASYINLFAISFRFASTKGLKPNEEVHSRIKKMYVFLNELRTAKNDFFHVGDNDNAELIYPYFDKEYNIYESMLNDSVIMYGVEKKSDYYFDLRNYILFGDEGLRKYEAAKIDRENADMCKLYSDSGYFVIKDNRVSILYDVGDIGLKPTMSHGHSDILSLILNIDKKPILVDCGSYQYNAYYKKERDYFHGVHSHNTIAVDSLDQAVLSNGMFWLSNPKVSVLNYSNNPDNPFCVAEHNGYCRRSVDVIHRREIKYSKNEKVITIYDTMTSDKEHRATFYLHFHPTVKIEFMDSKLIINDTIVFTNPFFKSGKIIRGDKMRPLGWYSKEYDAIEPTASFVFDFNFNKQEKIITQIKF